MSKIVKVSQSDYRLVVQPQGTITLDVGTSPGKVVITGDLLVQGETTTVNTTNIGTALVPVSVTHVGAYNHTGDTQQTGNFTLNGVLTVNNAAQFEDIKIDNNVITTTIDNNDLELAAAGTGRIYVPQNDVRIAQNLTVVGTTTSATINNSGTITSGTFSTGNISITGNTVSTTVTNSNLQLQANGTGTVDVGSKRITSVAEPTQATDAATKQYVDAVKTGLTVKDAARVATTSSLTVTYLNGTDGVGATLTNADTQAVLTIDSIPLTIGDRVLVKDQASAFQNGIYVVTDVGSASTNWVLTRATDFDQSPTGEIVGGDFVFVQEGTINADNGYVVTTNGAITVGTTLINWAQFSGAGQVVAGDGLTKSGNTLNVIGTADRITVTSDAVDIASTYVGQSTITTLGTIGTGVWQGAIISPTYGGTGVNNGTSTITLGGNLTTSGAFTTTLTVTADTSITLPSTGTLATLAGTESLSNKTITSSSFSGTTISASGDVTFTSTTDATALGTAPVILSGGLSVAKSVYFGANLSGAGASTSTLDGFNIDGGTY